MSDLYHISASPHIRSDITTKKIMTDVCIALAPATLFGIGYFGLNAFLLIVSTCAACVLTEYIYQKCMKLPLTTSDNSAFVTGLLLALNLPAGLPVWMAMFGGVFAILVVKQLFGGLGQNFMNPALAGRCFLMLCFTTRMTSFVVEKSGELNAVTGYSGIDGITGATPLAVLKGGTPPDVWEMFLGTTGGTIGETSALAILLGAAYLVFKKIISLRIPFVYIGTFALFIVIFGEQSFHLGYLAAHLCGGGLMLGAFFMATDYVTSPITANGKIIFGVILGLLTGVFRVFGATAEGVSYAIVIGNLFVPLIDRFTIPKPFGYLKDKQKPVQKERA